MATPEEQMARMDRTADDLLSAIKGTPDHLLAKRPDDKNWSPIEVLCHLRDTEESFMARFQTIMVMDEPKFPLSSPTAGHRTGSTSGTTRGRRSRRFGSGATSHSSSCAGSGPSRWRAAGCMPRAGA